MSNDRITPEQREVLARFADTIDAVGNGPAADNNDQAAADLVFFDYLKRRRCSHGGSGILWGDTPVPTPVRESIARLDRCAFGIDGLLTIIAAECNAMETGTGAIGANVLGRLLIAAEELNHHACNTFYDIVEVYPEVRS